MFIYPGSVDGANLNLKKKAASNFSRLAIISFLLITLVTAVLTYQLGHEMAIQLTGNRSSSSVVQQVSPALARPTSSAGGTGSGAPANSNLSNASTATGPNSAVASGSVAKTQSGTTSQQVQPKVTTKAS